MVGQRIRRDSEKRIEKRDLPGFPKTKHRAVAFQGKAVISWEDGPILKRIKAIEICNAIIIFPLNEVLVRVQAAGVNSLDGKVQGKIVLKVGD